MDVEAIRDAEVFPAALRAAVEGSDGFVFVISPDSVQSAFCEQEVDHALELGKRIVPLVRRRVADADIPAPIRERNWIPVESDAEFDDGVARLVTALETDLEHTKAHTHWTVRSLEWDGKSRDSSLLIGGSELAGAERWLAEAAGKEPAPTPLQNEYVATSRAAASRRLRRLAGAMAVGLAVSIALAIVALTQRNTARHQTKVARHQSAVAQSRELAAVSENQLATDPALSLLLGIEAVKSQPTPRAMLALREALDTSTLRKIIHGNRDGVYDVDWSPNGKLLATTSPNADDQRVTVLDTATWRPVYMIYPAGPPRPAAAHQKNVKVVIPRRTVEGQGSPLPNSVTFSPDGTTLAVGLGTGGTQLYDPATATVRGTAGPADHVDTVTFTRDGAEFLASGIGPPHLWNAQTLRLIRSFPGVRPEDPVGRTSLAGNGRYAAASLSNGGIVWDARTGKVVLRVHSGPEGTVGFDPVGRRLAYTDSGRRITVVDMRSRRRQVVANVAPAGVNDIAWSPDGARLAAALDDGTVRIWNASTGALLERYAGHRCCVISVAFSPDGREIATGAVDSTTNIWASSGNALAEIQPEHARVTGLAFTADGSVAIATRGKRTVLWRPGSRPLPVAGPAGPKSIAMSPDGRTLALAGPGFAITMVDAANGRVLRAPQIATSVNGVAFDATGKRLLVPTGAGTWILSATTGAMLSEHDTAENVSQAAFFPRHNAIAEVTLTEGTREIGSVVVKKLPGDETMTQVNALGPINAMGFNPSGTLLAVAAQADPGVRIYDPIRKRQLRLLLGHSAEVTAVAWSPDGRYVATTSLDRTVRLWNPATGDELERLSTRALAYAVAFSRDGKTLAIGDADGNVQLWPACPGCLDPESMLALAQRAKTGALTPLERRTFLGG
ncbi:MAG: hypothetical protein QOJ29_4348 [Thermoleophilaceae bacterium]|nr:hypothetical protein [Thermoleophilaceae bacterium]